MKVFKKYAPYILYGIGIIITLVISIYVNSSESNNVITSVTSMNQGGYDYKVYYKENPYYKEPFYDKTSKEFIAGSLVDKIDITFDYHLTFSDIVSNSISYYFETSLNVENKLDDIKTGEKEEEKIISNKNDLTKTISIDYNYYKDLYNNYINDLGTSYEGNAIIKVYFKVNSKVDYQSIDNLDNNTFQELIIPITSDPFEIKYATNISNKEKTITIKKNGRESIYNTIISISMWGIALLLLILASIRFNKEQDLSSPYKRKLSKILRNNDDLIVDVKRLPYLDSYEVIEVASFQELKDAAMNVNMPINFKEERRVAKFVVIKDNIAWIYYLKENKKA